MKLENHKAVIGLLDTLDRLTKIRHGKIYLRAGEDTNAKQIEYRVGGQKSAHSRDPSPEDTYCWKLQEKIDGDILEHLNVGLDSAIEQVKGQLKLLGVEL